MQFLFVLGAPRSGTTWLHRMLWEHRGIAAVEAELTVFTYLYHWDRRFQHEKYHLEQGHWKQGAPVLFKEDEFYHGMRLLADEAYSRVLKTNPEATHVLDKHPGYAQRLPLIDRLYPQCKVLHIIRDGREVAVSMISAKRRIGFGAGEIQGATRDWAQHIREARSASKQLGADRYLEVRYEDLMVRPEAALKEIFRFCGLQSTDEEIDRIAKANNIERKQVSLGDTSINTLRKIPDAIWQTKLSLEERWIMDRMAGDLLEELGYAKPGWWALMPAHKMRMFFYPLKKKIRNTLGSALVIWRTPVVKRLKP